MWTSINIPCLLRPNIRLVDSYGIEHALKLDFLVGRSTLCRTSQIHHQIIKGTRARTMRLPLLLLAVGKHQILIPEYITKRTTPAETCHAFQSSYKKLKGCDVEKASSQSNNTTPLNRLSNNTINGGFASSTKINGGSEQPRQSCWYSAFCKKWWPFTQKESCEWNATSLIFSLIAYVFKPFSSETKGDMKRDLLIHKNERPG